MDNNQDKKKEEKNNSICKCVEDSCLDKQKDQDSKTKLNQEIEQWKNKYLRALADYQNLERRISQTNAVFQKTANKRLLLKFLEILDNLEKSTLFIKDNGLKLIKDKFQKIFQTEGIKELSVLNKIFDPNTAECIEIIEGEKDNIVEEVLRKGYEWEGEVIRPAQVKVVKKSKL